VVLRADECFLCDKSGGLNIHSCDKANIRLKHHLIRHLPVTPSPQWGRQTALAFARARKINILQSASPYISLAQQYQIQGDSLRGARGFKRGEAPLPMGESGGPWVGPPAAFAPFVPVQMAYISRLYRKASYNKAEKEIFAYNTEPISDGRHHLISHLPVTPSPQWGRQKSARFYASAHSLIRKILWILPS